jgi:hypothetical protein
MNRRALLLFLVSAAALSAAAHAQKPICTDAFGDPDPSNYSTSCSTPVPDCSQNPTHIDCRGMEQILPGYAGANCTANDVSVVLVGLGVQQDGCTNPTDTADVLLRATLNVNANTRYDIGWFIPLTAAGSGRTGYSQPGYLYPVASSSSYGNGLPPYSDGDGDFCGEIQSKDGTTIFDYPFPVRLPCERVSAGFLSIPRCVVWDQSAGGVCSNIRQTGTNNAFNSKCNCAGSTDTDIPGPNLRLNCDSFNTSRTLNPGETGNFSVDYTNAVASCTPGTPSASDPFGRFRCGTVSFVRFVVNVPQCQYPGRLHLQQRLELDRDPGLRLASGPAVEQRRPLQRYGDPTAA